ncbi:hypothetical protein ACJJTC_007595 [Scirpophaga incertulas]
MIVKWVILFLSAFSILDAHAQYINNVPCKIPHLTHGRVRSRQRGKLYKFVCYLGYNLVGNTYSTCKNGVLDTPIPVCVKPGCAKPVIMNGVVVTTNNYSTVVFFCRPGFNLVGPTELYCDGRKWNGTAPMCVGEESTVDRGLSCDFENPDLCGWTQDALHDFDWERLNNKTPSWYVKTGPAYDHTFGNKGFGYYMYIESSSRMENSTARLISPVYDVKFIKSGCFSFFYHMWGRDIGGLRVYQKPENIELEVMLALREDDKKQYILFERWGRQGDQWYGSVTPLKNISVDFQIVIEGIRGKSYTSDIAIDDVAILQGENCTLAADQAPTPYTTLAETCEGRCFEPWKPVEGQCACYTACVYVGTCCSDFYDMCFSNLDFTAEDTTLATTARLPQTEKLVNSTPEIVSPTVTTTKKLTSTTTKKLTTTLKPTNTRKKENATYFQKDEIKDTPKPELTTLKSVPTKTLMNVTQVTRYSENVKPTTTVIVTSTTQRTVPIKVTRRTVTLENEKEKAKENDQLTGNQSGSGAWKPVLICIALALCVAGVAWAASGTRARTALAYVRGRASRDPEVRYLHSDVDDELNY